MAKKRKMMTEDSVKALVGKHIHNAQGFYSGNLSKSRERALDYYMGNPMGNEVDGRSKVISSDVSDAVEPLMANLMRIFTASNKLFHCEPVGVEDVDIAEQSTDYINHVFFKKNNGWVLLHNFIKDALIEKDGFLKVFHEYTDRVVRESYERLSDDEYSMLIDDRDGEVLEHTEYEDESITALGVMSENITSIDSGMGDDTTISIDNTPMLHDVVIHRTSKKGKTCIEGIPPEEMLVESNAKAIEDANFIAQRKMMTRGELIELGFDRGIVETLPNDRVEDMNQEYQTRHQDIHNTIQRENTDEATQEVEVFDLGADEEHR